MERYAPNTKDINPIIVVIAARVTGIKIYDSAIVIAFLGSDSLTWLILLIT